MLVVCKRCGSSERRPNHKGCVPCNRRTAREQTERNRPPADDSDIVITAAVRVYLAAFDVFVRARATGDTRRARAAGLVKAAALAQIQRDAKEMSR